MRNDIHTMENSNIMNLPKLVKVEKVFNKMDELDTD